MTRSLKSKMILSYLAVALLTVLVVSALIRLTSGRSLMSLVVEEQAASLTQMVQDYYTTNNSLNGFSDYYVQASRKAPPPSQPGNPGNPPDKHNVRGLIGLVDSNYRAVFPTLGYSIGQTVPQNLIKQSIPVNVNGITIAWILPDTSLRFQLSPEEELFLQRTTLAIGLAAVAGVLAALGIGFFLASRLLKPIRLLTKASLAMVHGELHQQVPVTSKDELGLLTQTFNQMSTDLDKADQQRRRMTADITHDLSTPLQIISGYIEMLEDDEVTLTPQRIEIIKTELEHLRRLVGDLTTLSQAEAGELDIQLEPTQPGVLLERVFDAFQLIAARQEVELVLNVADQVPPILIDEGRMVQVLKNLLENALRYTPRGGCIQLNALSSAETPVHKVQLQVKDSGQGIDAEDLPYVFDRFYRADKARGGNSGKMGLGLAICKALVTAQGGIISAESAGRPLEGKGQGTTMTITFNAALAE